MALVDLAKTNFSAGELSPHARGLTDLVRYRNGARRLENFRVLLTGGVTRRAGTRYVATAAGFCVLRPFEPSTADAYVIEMSHLLFRFYKDTASLGVSLATPYPTASLRTLRTAQVNDVMVIAHGDYAPRRLTRSGPTTFGLSLFPFYPPPTFEAGLQPATTIMLSATSGTITITAGATAFTDSDAQRQLTAGTGRAIVTAVTSGTTLTAIVIDAFDTTFYASGAWTLMGSPVAQLTVTLAGPVGAQVSFTLGQSQPAATELIAQDFTTWTDYSGTTILASGTHTGAANSTNKLEDTAQDFIAAGVLSTHVVVNTSDTPGASQGIVSGVSPHVVDVSGLLSGGADNDFDVGDAYQVHETGASRVTSTLLELTGGTAGHGWREAAVTTTVGFTYEVTFTVGGAPMALQIGSSAQASNLYAEASFAPGDHAVTFAATTTTSYVQFRNNQNVWAAVTAVHVRVYTIGGFRSTDVGKYLRVHGGLIHIRTIVNLFGGTGEIIRELSTTEPAPAGAWTLEEPAWSDTRGWPRAVVLYEQRLYLAGSASFPQTIWGSAVNNFADFYAGSNPADAVEFSVVDSGGNITLNVINWMIPAENMLMGTSHGEYRLIGSGDDPITAVTPPRARIQSSYGSDAVVMPIKVDQALIFPQRQGSKLRELTFDQVATTRFQTRDMTILSAHLLRDARLLEVAYAPEPLGTIWGVRSDGVLLGLTYDIPEQITGWWRFVTAGQVESLAVIPHPTQNRHQVWLSVNRDTGRFIEVMDEEAEMVLPTPIEGEAVRWQGLTVDAGVVYNGVATATITGLTHLNGQTVDIVGDGAVLPQQVVSGGQVVLAQPVTSAFVGLHFEALGETLPPDLQQSTIRRGRKRWVELMLLLEETIGLTVQGQAVDFRTANQPMDQGLRPFSGDVLVDTFGWDRDATLTFAQTQPLPAVILGYIGQLDIEVER